MFGGRGKNARLGKARRRSMSMSGMGRMKSEIIRVQCAAKGNRMVHAFFDALVGPWLSVKVGDCVCETNVGSMLTPTDAVDRPSAWSQTLTSDSDLRRIVGLRVFLCAVSSSNEEILFPKKKKKRHEKSSGICEVARALSLVFVGHGQRMPGLSETVYRRPLGLSIP